jgi:hypothetical protein
MTAREIQFEGALRASAALRLRAERRIVAYIEPLSIFIRSSRGASASTLRSSCALSGLSEATRAQRRCCRVATLDRALSATVLDLDEFLLVSPEDRAARLNRNGRAGGRAEIKSKIAL